MTKPLLRLVLASLVVVGLALLASGCGSGSGKVEEANAYVKDVNRAQRMFAGTVDQLAGRITSTSTTRQDRRTMTRFQTAVDRVVADLRAVNAPDRVAPLHRELVDEIGAYAGNVRKAAKGIESNNAKRLLKAQQDLADATTKVSAQINRTIDRINKGLQG
jgi:hypothetical protein